MQQVLPICIAINNMREVINYSHKLNYHYYDSIIKIFNNRILA